jgi:phosphomannomutase
MTSLRCFKAYDIRGRVGRDLDASIARAIGRAFAEVLGAQTVVLGGDCRLSSPELMAAVAEGLMAAGVQVLTLGLCGTEEVYHATDHLGAEGGIMVTASHNPAGDNGMKMVRAGAAPLDARAGLDQIRARTATLLADWPVPVPGGIMRAAEGARAAYVARVASFVDAAALPSLVVLVDAGHGAAGPTFDVLAEVLAARGSHLRFHRVRHAPDGRFPFGVPNPMLTDNRAATAREVVAAGADMGIAWDGDFDRCFFFDHTGRFVPGEYVVGLLADAFLRAHPGAAIVHDPRVVLNTRDVVAKAKGRAVMAPTGHAYLKAAMRDSGAIYGGEMSAHHYFRDFMACDSGMIPWLLVAQVLGTSGQTLAALVDARRTAFPSSGEINFAVPDPDRHVARVRAAYADADADCDETDGVSMNFPDWRFNLRVSHTEGLLRLNVESRGRPDLVRDGVAAITALITAL